MAKIISIAAPLADTGKTLAAINLSAAFAVFEQKTLLIDCAPDNRCLTGAVLVPPTQASGLSQALGSGTDPGKYLVSTCLPFLQVLGAGQDLDGVADNLPAGTEGSQRFSEIICAQAREHDVIVLDTGTVFSSVLEWVLCASDELLIPLRLDPTAPEYLSTGFAAIKSLMDLLNRLRQEQKSELRVSGILFNCCDDMHAAEAVLGPAAFDRIKNICLPVTIPEDPCLHEAYWLGKPAVCHNVASAGARAYLDLAALWDRAPKKYKADRKEFQP